MHTLIIAEAGVNHNGSLVLAKKLVTAGAEAGADIIKFQTFNPEALTSVFAETAQYQKINTGKEESQLDMLKALTLSRDDHMELIDFCNKSEIRFCSSPFDLESIDFLQTLDLPFWKIPSGEITNLPYLKKIAQSGKSVILSTGMSNLTDIESALEILYSNGLNRDDITLLHCNTEYPTPASDVNLNVLKSLGIVFDVKIGYSDHTVGIEFPIAAVALGACVIEKHLTLDKAMDGPDHKASLNPSEFKSMVRAIRNVEIGMGHSVKHPSESEKKNLSIARKSIIASRDIDEGTLFSEENLSVKRPGNGLSPMLWNSVIGKSARRSFQKDECIEI